MKEERFVIQQTLKIKRKRKKVLINMSGDKTNFKFQVNRFVIPSLAMGYCFSGCGSCPGHWMIGGLRYIILQIISIFLYWV
jgi:hypothetical protein